MASYGSTPYPTQARTRPRMPSIPPGRYVPEQYRPHQEAPPPSADYPKRPSLPSIGYPYPYGKPAPPVIPTVPPQLGQPTPAPYLHPARAAEPPYPSDSYIPSPNSGRRDKRSGSYGSSHRHRSPSAPRRSHSSHRSRADSHHSRRRSHHDSSDEHYWHGRRSKESQRKDKHDNERKLRRAETHKPTLGDTMFALWDGLKMVMSPRDKY